MVSVQDLATRMATKVVTRGDLAELSLQCTTGQLGAAETDHLICIMENLAEVVKLAVSQNLLESAAAMYVGSPSQASAALGAWIMKGQGALIVNTIRDGLEAAAIVAHVGSLKHVDQRILHEEAINASILLMQVNLTKHLVPSLSNKSHAIATSSGKKRRGSAPPEGAIAGKDLKKIYEPITQMMTLQLILMDRLKTLAGNLSIDSQQVAHLTAGALRSLGVDSLSSSAKSSSVQQLQMESIMILTALFRRYPNHRDSILDEILSLIPALPSAKRSLRTFPISYSSSTSPSALRDCNSQIVGPLLSHQNHTIQMVTALIISLVQCCVMIPTFARDDSGDHFQSGLLTCQAMSDAFVGHLLQRCKKSTSGPSTDSYRAMLSNFTEDLLLVLLVPEYPASKLLVSSLEKFLKLHLSKSTRVFGNDQQSLEATYLNSAFDMLGKICSVKAGILAASRLRPVTLTTKPPMSLDTEENESVSCHCSSKRTDVFLVQCDSCNDIYHGMCIGIPDKESVPETWSCDSCCLGRIVVRERSKRTADESDSIDKSYVLHHSVRAMTSHRLGVDMEDAVRIGLASWIETLETQGKSMRRTAAALLEYWDKPGPAGESLSEEGVVRVILSLASEDLPKNIRSQIGFILKILEDPSNSTLRKLSLKVIDQIVKGDQSTMMIPVVATKVAQRLSDDSIAVREAAVALVGEYIARSPGAVKRYGTALVPCLKDPGVSVRKRVIRIFEHILISCPNYRSRDKVCSIMLECAANPKEEDSVRDLIDDLFATLWLSCPSSSSSRKRLHSEFEEQIVSIPGVVTPTSPALIKKRTARKSDLAAEQMMEVVKLDESGSHLEAMLKKLLTGGAVESDSTRKQSERKKRQELGLYQCVELVDSLFELLVVVDEQRDIRPAVGKDIASTLGAISVFASVCPHQVVKHIDTLLPYIKADNGVSPDDEALIVSSACVVVTRLAPVFDSQMLEKLSETSIAKDLGKICYRFGSSAIDRALEAFSVLAHHDEKVAHFEGKLMSVAKVFYEFLLKKLSIENFTNTSAKARSGVFRALTILGYICQHFQTNIDFDWTGEVESPGAIVGLEEFGWEILPVACFRVVSAYLLKDGTQCKALSALKGLFLAHPHLLLQSDHHGLFEQVMGEAAGVDLQLESLLCWGSILNAEEVKIDSGEAAAQMDQDGNVTVSKRVSGDQNGDATVFGSVLNKHAPRLFTMLHSSNQRVRFSTLKLLGIALRQGLLNPNEVVPHLFALQGELGSLEMRDLALKLLTTEGEKRPDVLRQRMCAGVKQAFEFQKRVSATGKIPSGVIATTRGSAKIHLSIFNQIFEQWIVKQRKLRESIYKSLVRLFDFETLLDDCPPNVPLLAFVAQVLAHLPYTTALDPLFIIHHATQLVILQGSQLQDQMADFLRQFGLSSSDSIEASNTETDQLEKAARKKFPSRTNEAQPLISPEFDIEVFSLLCQKGRVISLLLSLKTFLMKHYNLSIARCLEYDPSTTERLMEKMSAKVVFRDVFDTSNVSLNEESANNVDNLIRHYATFRQDMRAEQYRAEANESEVEGE